MVLLVTHGFSTFWSTKQSFRCFWSALFFMALFICHIRETDSMKSLTFHILKTGDIVKQFAFNIVIFSLASQLRLYSEYAKGNRGGVTQVSSQEAIRSFVRDSQPTGIHTLLRTQNGLTSSMRYVYYPEADSGFSLWGGGGCKRLCVRSTKSLAARVEGLLSCTFWALFLSILIQNGI